MTTGFVLPYAYLTTITTISGQVYGFSSTNHDVNYRGIIYTGAVGSSPTATKSVTGLSVDNLELILTKTGTPFTELQVTRGLLENAIVEVQIEDLMELPGAGLENFIFKGQVGRVQSLLTSFKIELRSNTSKLNNPYSFKTSPYCRWGFGSTDCGLNLAANNLSLTTTVASTTDSTITLATPLNAVTRPNFKLGRIRVTSGADINREIRILDVDLAGTLLTVPGLPPFGLASGSGIEVVAYCSKTQDQCKLYNNFSNFGGFPNGGNFMKGLNSILLAGDRAGEST